MRFKLFGRLRDDENGSSSDSMSTGEPAQDFGDSPAMGGGNLDRTVESMFSQGYSQDEIKDELEDQYSPQEIDRAVNTAVAASASGGSSLGNRRGPEPMTPYQGDEDAASPMDEGFGEQQTGGQQFEPDTREMAPIDSGQEQGYSPDTVDPSIEELIETIVAENLDRVRVEFENVYSEIDEMKEQVEDIDSRVHDLEVRDDEDQQQFVQKVTEMEDHIDSYQSRIGGLEKAFQQVLPSLVDNVRDLTDLVHEIKQDRGIETEKSVSSEDIEDIDVNEW